MENIPESALGGAGLGWADLGWALGQECWVEPSLRGEMDPRQPPVQTSFFKLPQVTNHTIKGSLINHPSCSTKRELQGSCRLLLPLGGDQCLISAGPVWGGRREMKALN